jgi:hypothetical protein
VTNSNRDPVQYIQLVIIPSHSGDPDAEPTPDQLELVERYPVELGHALSQHALELNRYTDDRGRERARRLVLKVQRAMLGIRPHELRRLINDVTNELWKEFESNWRQWRWRQREEEERAYCRSVLGESEIRRLRGR